MPRYAIFHVTGGLFHVIARFHKPLISIPVHLKDAEEEEDYEDDDDM